MRGKTTIMQKIRFIKCFFLYFLTNLNFLANAQDISYKTPQNLIKISTKQQKYALILEKQNHVLSVYKQTENNLFETVKTYLAITGKKDGDKKYTGDARTPEGVYFITKKMNKEHLASKYGPGAFVLDYPNVFDLRLKKSGYGIWIHGIENNKRIESLTDTKGCVALQNEDWIDLQKYISIRETPLIITQKVSFFPSKEAHDLKNQQIMSFIKSWKKSWEESNLDQYIDFYSNTFTSNTFNKKSWYEMKKSIANSQRDKIEIELSDINIYSFDNEVVISFLQKYVSSNKSDYGKKFLYLKDENGNYKIESEKFYKENTVPQESHST